MKCQVLRLPMDSRCSFGLPSWCGALHWKNGGRCRPFPGDFMWEKCEGNPMGCWSIRFPPLIFFWGDIPKTPFVAVFRAAHLSNTIPVLSSCWWFGNLANHYLQPRKLTCFFYIIMLEDEVSLKNGSFSGGHVNFCRGVACITPCLFVMGYMTKLNCYRILSMKTVRNATLIMIT